MALCLRWRVGGWLRTGRTSGREEDGEGGALEGGFGVGGARRGVPERPDKGSKCLRREGRGGGRSEQGADQCGSALIDRVATERLGRADGECAGQAPDQFGETLGRFGGGLRTGCGEHGLKRGDDIGGGCGGGRRARDERIHRGARFRRDADRIGEWRRRGYSIARRGAEAIGELAQLGHRSLTPGGHITRGGFVELTDVHPGSYRRGQAGSQRASGGFGVAGRAV